MINEDKTQKKSIISALTPRLLKIAEMAEGGENIADIGTDHAYVPIYLLLCLGAKYAIAADINKGPLERADANIKKYGLEERIKTRLSDGLKEFSENDADTVIIAGMGGTLIAKILGDSPQMKKENITFVLQPMTAEEELRKYLVQNGYYIVDEKMAQEGEKLYTVMTVKVGKSEPMEEVFYHVGKKLFENKEKLFPLLLSKKHNEFEKVVKGLSKALQTEETKEKKEYYSAISDDIKKLIKECKKWSQ